MNTIFEYVYNRDADKKSNKNRRPIGVVLATRDRDTVYVGWSKCKNSDTFDKRLGYDIALNRALSRSVVAVPHSMKPSYDAMVGRAHFYFKDCPVFVTEKDDEYQNTPNPIGSTEPKKGFFEMAKEIFFGKED